MNEITPYEALIADKLDQVPVPDMADSIWAGIERQLDLAAGTAAKRTLLKYRGNAWYIYIGMIAIIAFLCIVWWYNDHSRKNNAQKNAPASKTLPAMEPLNPVKDSITLHSHIKENSILMAPVSIKAKIIKMDSLSIPAITAPMPVFNPVIYKPMINPQEKKPKGVKGITGKDYRISVKNDSTKN